MDTRCDVSKKIPELLLLVKEYDGAVLKPSVTSTGFVAVIDVFETDIRTRLPVEMDTCARWRMLISVA
jgi:hypothetical protein